MNKRIILPVLGLFIIVCGLTGFWIYKNQAFAESDVPVLSSDKVNLELDFESMSTVEEGQETQDPTWFTQEGADYMRTYLLEPSEKLNDFVDEDEFSRCGSGAYYTLKSKPTDDVPYFLGEVTLSKGCDGGDKFFDFRVNPDGSILEISDPGKNAYIPYKEWFKTAKPIF